jgi:hypothetical protein
MVTRISIVSALLLSVAACGGSSGDDTSPAGTPSNPLAFQGFSDLEVGITTRLFSTARVIPFVENSDGSVSYGDTEFKLVSADVTPNANGNRTVVLRQEGQPDLEFGPNDAAYNYRNGSLIVTKEDGSGFAVLADETQTGHEYQTYGAWLNTPASGGGWANVGSFGRRTASQNMPTGTIAIYHGHSVGLVADTGGTVLVTNSRVTVETDFNSATLTSSDTWVEDIATGNGGFDKLLDFSATAENVNDSLGTALISTPYQIGTASVGFYGPNAEEVGGEWGTTGTNFNYGAAYGAKR